MAPTDISTHAPLALDLDPEVARLRSRHRDARLHTVEIPQQRALVLTAVTVLVWLHVALVPGSGDAQGSLLFSVVAAGYGCLSWLLLRCLYRPEGRSWPGLVFLVCDVLVFAVAIWFTGAERSWLFLLPVVRVADQAFLTMRRTMGFALFGVAVYAALVVAARAQGHQVPLGPEAVKLGALLLVGLHIAATSTTAERERSRMAATLRQSRSLIEELDAKTTALAHSHAELRAASTARSEFLAGISHELRTPMNGILGTLELALATELSADQAGLLRTAHSSTLSLLRVVGDILDFSTAGAGRIELLSVPFSVRETVRSAVDALAPAAGSKLLPLRWRVSDDVPTELLGDPERLTQVLTSLLGNAIKFTEQGAVELELDVESRTPRSALLHVQVSDTGMGISPEKQIRIFEPFTQADSSSKRVHGGTGLGLALATRLVELMGGRIWVESTEGEGSRFHFAVSCGIPRADDSPASASPTATATQHDGDAPARVSLAAPTVEEAELALPVEALGDGAPGGPLGAPMSEGLARDGGSTSGESAPPSALSRRTSRPLRLLLVEDNKVNQLVARRILSTWGHFVDVAENGRLALDALATARYDAVLMDIAMPVMDGFEATRKLRLEEQRKGGHLPIIAMTAHASAGDRERCLEGGMDDYVSKPVQPELLYAAVERVQLQDALGRG